jgi:hypothetical protein
MNTCLVLHLDIDPEIGKQRSSAADGGVFSLPGQIAPIKVKDVVILRAPAGRVTGYTVPSCLEETACSQETLAQSETGQTTKKLGIHRICHHIVDERL